VTCTSVQTPAPRAHRSPTKQKDRAGLCRELRISNVVVIGTCRQLLFTACEVTNMILISGNDPIVDCLCSALDALGRTYHRVEALDANHAWELRATTVVLVEQLPRVTAMASASERGLREIISAANAPGVRSAVILPHRSDADAELRALRRSGIPYTILRPLPVVDRALDTSHPVLVARDVARAPATAVTIDMVTEAVLGVLDGGACGQTLEVTPPPETTWQVLLERTGVTPKPVARWRARVGRWLGAQTLDVPLTNAPATT
jgi:hypothetical protein